MKVVRFAGQLTRRGSRGRDRLCCRPSPHRHHGGGRRCTPSRPCRASGCPPMAPIPTLPSHIPAAAAALRFFPTSTTCARRGSPRSATATTHRPAARPIAEDDARAYITRQGIARRVRATKAIRSSASEFLRVHTPARLGWRAGVAGGPTVGVRNAADVHPGRAAGRFYPGVYEVNPHLNPTRTQATFSGRMPCRSEERVPAIAVQGNEPGDSDMSPPGSLRHWRLHPTPRRDPNRKGAVATFRCVPRYSS